MKNTIESDAKVSALESAPFIPSEVERLESLPDDVLESLARETGLLPAARMDYVICNATDGKIRLEVNYSQESSFFYSFPMFEDGKWVERMEHKGFLCIRADLCTVQDGLCYVHPTRPEFVPPSGVAGDLWRMFATR